MSRPDSLFRVALLSFATIVVGACAHLRTGTGPVVADRPGFTDAPTVLPPGAVQLEAGFTDDRIGDNAYKSVGETLLRIGLQGPLELRLFGNSFGARTAPGMAPVRGMEDVKVGIKLRLVEKPDSVHGLTPNLALLVASTLPTGARGIGAGAAQPEAKIAASWTMSTPLSFYTNAGVGSVYDGAAWSSHGWGSIATWYAVNAHLSLFVEAIDTRAMSGPAAPSRYADAGLTLLFGEQVQVDVRAGRGLSRPVTGERFVGLGIGRRF